MPPRRVTRPALRNRPRPRPQRRRSTLKFWVSIGLTLLLLGSVAWLGFERDRPRRLLARAEAATRARDWPSALASWRDFNRTRAATARTWLLEARAALALDRGLDAAIALEHATEASSPDVLEVWQTRLDRLRLLDRPLEALELVRVAIPIVRPSDRRTILAGATLAVLAELPDDDARTRLDRWIAADPDDLDARVARLARIAANPHLGDPDRASRITELARLLDRSPGHIPVREALVIALADAGEVDRGRSLLEAWPEARRDARYDRLRGRWDLDHDHQPARAAEAYRRALVALPHDWKSHYGLARALKILGQEAEARLEAETVARLRERLEPAAIGPRLARDFEQIDDPRTATDLADLCESVGLAELGEAWRREARLFPFPFPSPMP